MLTVFIQDDGNVTFLASELTAGFNLGPSVTRRYSSVEPDNAVLRTFFRALRCLFGDKGRVARLTRDWRCLWRATIAGGPTLPGRYDVRQDAINAEIAYFDTYGVKI